jgi:hypothetical protein
MKTEDVLAYENEQRFVREALGCYRADVVVDPSPPMAVSHPAPDPDAAAHSWDESPPAT